MTAEMPSELGIWECLTLPWPTREGISEVRLLQTAAKTRATFDDPNLVSHTGLVPAVRLAEKVGLEDLVRERVHVAAKVGANVGLKVGSLVAGMVAGADTIDGMDLLRHGAIPATFGGIRAPSTLGSFLRAFDHGNVRQLAAVHRRVLAELAAQTPLLPGADATSSPGTCPKPGPGRTLGKAPSTAPTAPHPSWPPDPDHPPLEGPTGDHSGHAE